MRKRLTKKDRFFNDINFTADDDIYVGIDVHKVDYHIAIWLNNGIALTFVAPADNSAIARELDKLTPGIRHKEDCLRSRPYILPTDHLLLTTH
ncbi:MAG: hypothetical protein KOO69_04905 [Victivallales bacterium]|nr:hypothetical protein [Victivallales bacterium]